MNMFFQTRPDNSGEFECWYLDGPEVIHHFAVTVPPAESYVRNRVSMDIGEFLTTEQNPKAKIALQKLLDERHASRT
jgi:hypothetical protein